VAANIRFLEKIKISIITNVKATDIILNIAKCMSNLKVILLLNNTLKIISTKHYNINNTA